MSATSCPALSFFAYMGLMSDVRQNCSPGDFDAVSTNIISHSWVVHSAHCLLYRTLAQLSLSDVINTSSVYVKQNQTHPVCCWRLVIKQPDRCFRSSTDELNNCLSLTDGLHCHAYHGSVDGTSLVCIRSGVDLTRTLPHIELPRA